MIHIPTEQSYKDSQKFQYWENEKEWNQRKSIFIVVNYMNKIF